MILSTKLLFIKRTNGLPIIKTFTLCLSTGIRTYRKNSYFLVYLSPKKTANAWPSEASAFISNNYTLRTIYIGLIGATLIHAGAV